MRNICDIKRYNRIITRLIRVNSMSWVITRSDSHYNTNIGVLTISREIRVIARENFFF